MKPAASLSETLRREATMTLRARKGVLAGAKWLTAAQVAEGRGWNACDLDTWLQLKQIFAIELDGVKHFPEYGMDPLAAHRPRRAIAEILEIFENQKDGWGLAYWFLGVNGFLGGRRPQDVLSTDPDSVVAAARDEATTIAHA